VNPEPLASVSPPAGSAKAAVVDTRSKILEVAADLFMDRGYAGTSVNAIGKRLGISAPALYWHFPSKEAILFALLEQVLDRFTQALETSELDPVPRLSALVRQYVLFQLENRRAAAGFTSMAPPTRNDLSHGRSSSVLIPEHQDKFVKLQRGVYETFLNTIRDGARSGVFDVPDPVPTTFAIIAMCEHVNEWARPRGRLSPHSIASHYVTLALRMVGAADVH
jgi:AcrR family transcriptional regulator